jgi:hypothetical protein
LNKYKADIARLLFFPNESRITGRKDSRNGTQKEGLEMAPGLRFVRGGPKEHHPLPHVNDER